MARVRVQRPDDVLEVLPTILTEDSMQAQHLAATLALYNLVKGQVIYAEDATSFSLVHDLAFIFSNNRFTPTHLNLLVSAPAPSSNLQRCVAGVERQRAAETGREPHGRQQTSRPVHLPASGQTQTAAEPEPLAGIKIPRSAGGGPDWG